MRTVKSEGGLFFMPFVGQGLLSVMCLPLDLLTMGGADISSEELSDDLDTQRVGIGSFIGELEK